MYYILFRVGDFMPDLENLVVKKSNAIARAPWSISSVWGPRIVAAIVAQINNNDEDFREYEVNALDFIRATRLGKKPDKLSGKIIKDIDLAIKQILRIPISYEGTSENGKRYILYCNIFSKCIYVPEDGVIRANFIPELKPFFLQLKSHFTLYPLTEFLGLSSIYSQKLYEFLNSWKSKGIINIPLEQLHDVLDSPKSLRRLFGSFKQMVLIPTEREINAKTSLHYTWEQIKTGRKVTAIRFRFGECRTGDVDSGLSAHLTDKSHDDDHNKWQRLSNACFERHFMRCEVCKPNNGRKCDFCQTRGRLLGGRTPEEAFKATHEAHRRMVAAGLEPPPEKTKRKP